MLSEIMDSIELLAFARAVAGPIHQSVDSEIASKTGLAIELVNSDTTINQKDIPQPQDVHPTKRAACARLAE